MKKLILLAAVFASSMGITFAQSDYYWYKGKKVPVHANKKKKYVLLDDEKKSVDSASFKSTDAKVKSLSLDKIPATIKKHKAQKAKERVFVILESDSKINDLNNKDVVYEAPFYTSTEGSEAALTNHFYVKLNKGADLNKLEKLAAKHNVEIVGSNVYMPLWYTLSVTNSSSGNALEMANLFYESGLFAMAEPEFLIEINPNCKNDTYFGRQWGLNNTSSNAGTAGIDINACDGWNISEGTSNVIVAVVDEGVQLDHPDLTHMSPLSFDAHTGTSPSVVRGSHGTACAGIIGANANNGSGVAGVAPNAEIMSISIKFGSGGSSPARFADGINYAWQNGAAVISNSWYYGGFGTGIIDDAIDNALHNGRNGLGTVVVFAAGNSNGSISNPADNNPHTLVVGALSPCGERKNPSSCDGETWWGSSFGSQLDVMAPGVLIPTTYPNSSYSVRFNGTSSAAPHAAGLAALLISVNPDLTRQEVVDIIEQTAQKVGSYSYGNQSGRPNGTWHNEMGYGLIDVEAALELAAPSSDLLGRFGVPRSSGIPAGFRKYSNVHTIGTGGPNMSNVFNSVFNWWGNSNQPNGLYQFTLETNNGQPRYYTNIPDFASYSLHQSGPEITINSGIGFAGMEGSYWVNLDGDNLVLVEKSGAYALYFSNSSTPPAARLSDFASEDAVTYMGEEKVKAEPNPFSHETVVRIPAEFGDCELAVYNVQGKLIETLNANQAATLGANYQSGLYLVKIKGENGVHQISFVKQ